MPRSNQPDTPDAPTLDQRVLLLAPNAERAAAISSSLEEAGLEVATCENPVDLRAGIEQGALAAVIVGTLANNDRKTLEETLQSQADWSDFPLIVLADHAADDALQDWAAQSNANVALLQPPLPVENVVSVVRIAARARGRQYARRDEQTQYAGADARLRGQTTRLGKRIRRQSEVMHLLRDVATAANFAESIEEALSFALAQICRINGWSCGHAFLADPVEPDILRPVDAYYEQATGRYRSFREATQQMTFARGEGLPGRVYASGQPEWTRGIDKHLDPQRAPLASELHLALAAAFPIMAGRDIVGVLEIVSEETGDIAPQMLEAMASIGTQVGRVIERARAERTLRDSYHLIEKISDTAPTMIRLYDLDDDRYVFVNRQMSEFLGKPAEMLIRSPFNAFLEAVHHDDVDHARHAKKQVQESHSDTPVAWQVRMQNASGQWRWVRTWSVAFASHAGTSSNQVLSISIDVNDEVEAETKLRQTERLTSIGTLAAGIAHEINNPLASVVMTAQLLRRRKLDKKTHQMLADLIEDARRCGRIVRNVQRFARQEPSERRPVNLNGVIRAAEELSRAEVRHAGVRTRLDLDDQLHTVAGDPTELEQVVVNLITNAGHASQKGQEIVVSTRCDGPVVRLRVRDQGRGMTPEAQRHAFDPFYTTRGREGGTGLGLSIAHGIIEDHGGTIDIDSALGQGTTVTITLPADNT